MIAVNRTAFAILFFLVLAFVVFFSGAFIYLFLNVGFSVFV